MYKHTLFSLLRGLWNYVVPGVTAGIVQVQPVISRYDMRFIV